MQGVRDAIPTNVELDMVFGSSIMTFRTVAKRPSPILRRIDSNLRQVITAILHVLKCWSGPLFALALVVFFAADGAP
jgi:hypothetical protein